MPGPGITEKQGQTFSWEAISTWALHGSRATSKRVDRCSPGARAQCAQLSNVPEAARRVAPELFELVVAITTDAHSMNHKVPGRNLLKMIQNRLAISVYDVAKCDGRSSSVRSEIQNGRKGNATVHPWTDNRWIPLRELAAQTTIRIAQPKLILHNQH